MQEIINAVASIATVTPAGSNGNTPAIGLAAQSEKTCSNGRISMGAAGSSTDKVGTELCAALKNIIALCAGCCDGMGCGDNTKALLMTRGLAEMARLGVALGGRKDTFTGLAGVGDLIVTCTSMHSRNRRCGILIGKGVEPKEAVKEIGAVVEGYYAAVTARTLAQKAGIEMPIAQAAYEVLYEGRDAHLVLTELMTREKKHELEDSWV